MLADASRQSFSAIEQMHRAGVEPGPRNYELFYRYKSGVDSALNKALDDLLAAGPRPEQSVLDRLYEEHISAVDAAEAVAKLGDRLSDQINEAIELVQKAVDQATQFGGSITEAGEAIREFDDPARLAGVVESLVQATETMGHASLELNRRLKASSTKVDQLQSDLLRFQEETHTDALTGIGNRRFFDSVLRTEMSRARRGGRPLCLCMTDIDHFKHWNDTFGHVAGDATLRSVAGLLSETVRDYDSVARYGGEEFAIILPETSLEAAAAVMERIRASLMHKTLVKRSTGESMGNVTASFGIAELREADNAELLIERADRCLFAAKDAGRNRVVTERLLESADTQAAARRSATKVA